MSDQLAYVLITPYTLSKSRTGGVLARLLARTGLDFVGARMFAPSAELIQKYADTIGVNASAEDKPIQEMIQDYVRRNMGPDPKTGQRRRVMSLLFKGEDAVRKVRSVVGNIKLDRRTGESIRDTYADLILDESGKPHYFEPAVLVAPNAEEAETKLKLWAKYSEADGGILDNVITYRSGEQPQRTLVLIKPDNFRFPSGRPGNMIDFFARTGLYIVAIKVHQMSVAQAMEFYGPVRDVLRSKLKDVIANKTKGFLEKECGLTITPEVQQQLAGLLGPVFGDSQFDSIVKFMSGRTPGECTPELLKQPGTEKCIALVYEGVDAVNKIRDVLGPTDPSKAPPGSIRKEFGQTIMVNAAHASDAPENAQREIGIVKPGENLFSQIVEEHYGKL